MDEKINKKIESNNGKIIVDTTAWDEQNEKDYFTWLYSKSKQPKKDFMFTYFESDNKEYSVEYLFIDKGYIPCIKKETDNNGLREMKYIQVGRLLSPFEYDEYLLRRYEKSVLEENSKNTKKDDDPTM